jgi:hypothetical protein
MKIRLVVQKSTEDESNAHFVLHNGTKLIETAADIAGLVVLARGNTEKGSFASGAAVLDENDVECEIEVEGSTYVASLTDTETWASFEIASLHSFECWLAERWKGRGAHTTVRLTIPEKK